MDTITLDGKPQQLASHLALAQALQGAPRLPPSEGSHGLASPRGQMSMLSRLFSMQPSSASQPPGQNPLKNSVSHTPGECDAGSYFIRPDEGPLGQRQWMI